MNFICTGCGLCCKRIGPSIEAAKTSKAKDPITKQLSSFPHSINEDGSCSMLGEDDKCTIYDKRPDICNVEKLYDKVFKKTEKKEDFFKRNNRICNDMIKSEGLSEEFLIEIK